MSRAYKLPNAASVIVEINAAQEHLNNLQQQAFALAATVGEGVTAVFRRSGFSDDTKEVVLRLDDEKSALAEGWRYVKTRDAVEPVRGAKGDAARAALAALEVPAIQPGTIVAGTGMPQVFMHPGRIYRTQWMQYDGALYALLPDEDETFRNDPITGDWVEIRLSELHAADEARMDAAKAAVAAQSA